MGRAKGLQVEDAFAQALGEHRGLTVEQRKSRIPFNVQVSSAFGVAPRAWMRLELCRWCLENNAEYLSISELASNKDVYNIGWHQAEYRESNCGYDLKELAEAGIFEIEDNSGVPAYRIKPQKNWPKEYSLAFISWRVAGYPKYIDPTVLRNNSNSA